MLGWILNLSEQEFVDLFVWVWAGAGARPMRTRRKKERKNHLVQKNLGYFLTSLAAVNFSKTASCS